MNYSYGGKLMGAKFILLFSQWKVFWSLRATTKRLIFKLQTLRYKFIYGFREEKDNILSMGSLTKIAVTQLLFAILISILLQVVDHYLLPYYKELNINIPEDGLYGTLFSAISAIGGVFIGLYYAGISAVGSSIYSKVPNEVRNLLANEKIGFVYMRLLSFTTFISFCFIAMRALGLPRNHIAIPFICILAGIGIIGFIRLGQRTFYLFDPSSLSVPVLHDVYRDIKRVSAGGYQWDDPSFQNHAAKQVRNNLDILRSLAEITSKERHLLGKPYVQLIQKIIIFMINYEKMKKRIPSKSNWYIKRYKHRLWYRTSDSTVSIALQSSSLPQPEIEHEHFWVEDLMLGTIKTCLNSTLNRSIDEEHPINLLNSWKIYTDTISSGGDFSRAIDQISTVADVILDNIKKSDEYIIEQESLILIHLVESIMYMTIESFLNYISYLRTVSVKELNAKLSVIDWRLSKSIYSQDMPIHLLQQLEWLRDRLEYEYLIEDKVISPPWYILELVLKVNLEKYVTDLEAIFVRCSSLFNSWIEMTESMKRPLLSAAILSREWEFWGKVEAHLTVLEEAWIEAIADKRIKGLIWPSVNFDDLLKQKKLRKIEAVKQMSTVGGLLNLLSKSDKLPDYGGQFINICAYQLLDAMCNNNFELFKILFKKYLYSSIATFSKLKPTETLPDWRKIQEFKIAVSPLLDLIEISGYAKVASEFYEESSWWAEVVDIWDNYIKEDSDLDEIFILLSSAINLTEGTIEIAHRSSFRLSWQQNILALLSQIQRKEIFSDQEFMFRPKTLIFHPSALVRMISKEDYQRFGSFRDGIGLFMYYFFKAYKKCDLSKLSSRKRNFNDIDTQLLTEEKFYQENVNSDKEEDEL
jgi:hypothetical protein